MNERAQGQLRTLLFGSDRELVNFKFFPGMGVRACDELCAAAHYALGSALDSDMTDLPPATGRQKVTAADMLKAA